MPTLTKVLSGRERFNEAFGPSHKFTQAEFLADQRAVTLAGAIGENLGHAFDWFKKLAVNSRNESEYLDGLLAQLSISRNNLLLQTEGKLFR